MKEETWNTIGMMVILFSLGAIIITQAYFHGGIN